MDTETLRSLHKLLYFRSCGSSKQGISKPSSVGRMGIIEIHYRVILPSIQLRMVDSSSTVSKSGDYDYFKSSFRTGKAFVLLHDTGRQSVVM